MCRSCSCGPVSLRVGVFVIAAVEMLHDALFLMATIWHVIWTTDMYESMGQERQPIEVAAVVIQVILRCVDLLFTVMLIHGVIKESIKQIMAWWWWYIFLLAMGLVRFVWLLVTEAKNNELVGVPVIIASIVVTISVLFLMVVRSYVNYLRRKKLLPYISFDEDIEEDV